MASPIYFFPKLTRAELVAGNKLSPEVLSRYGDLARTLADVVDLDRDASLTELTGRGPGGSSGCLLCPLPVEGPPPVRLCYKPDFQTWQKINLQPPASGRQPADLWVGVDNEHPITPADLQRRETFPGYSVDLAGGKWTVPIIRDPEGGSILPRDFVYAAGGKVEQRIKSAYVDLWERFARACWLFYDPEGPWPETMDVGEATDLCLDALSLNYRVGRIEQNLLGLIDSDTWNMILGCAVDVPTFQEVYRRVEREKKTRAFEAASIISREMTDSPASTDSMPGPEDGSPDTGPAEESCER